MRARVLSSVLAVAALLITAAAAAGADQTKAGTITSTTCPGSGCVELAIAEGGSGSVQITGAAVATYAFEFRVNASTWLALPVFVPGATASITSSTADGAWIFGAAGYSAIRVRASAYTSGTGTITLKVSPASQVTTVASSAGGGASVVPRVSTTGTLGLSATSNAVTLTGLDGYGSVLTQLRGAGLGGTFGMVREFTVDGSTWQPIGNAYAVAGSKNGISITFGAYTGTSTSFQDTDTLTEIVPIGYGITGLRYRVSVTCPSGCFDPTIQMVATTTVLPIGVTVNAVNAIQVDQGNTTTQGNGWYTRLTDGTNGPVAAKAASTLPAATDKALVVTQRDALPAGANTIGAVSNTAFGISGTLPAYASTPAFTISGTLPAYASTPTFNLGTLNGAALDATITGRLPAGASPADAETNTNTNLSRVGAFAYVFNGTTWDRVRGDTANGVDVDVTRSALPTGAATSAKQPALGTAGAASADVITVQGVASMTALKVDGSAVTQPVSGTVTTTPPANASVNLSQVAGVTTSTGLGIADTGTQRIALTQEATYAAGTTLKTATAAGTAAFLELCGSGTKTIRLQRIMVSGTVATAAVYGDLQIRKNSSAATGGTATTLTTTPYDSNSAAATATAKYFTVLPTGGAVLVGNVLSETAFFPITGTVATMQPQLIYVWRDTDAEAPTLRGAAQCVTAGFGTTPTNAPTLSVSVAWTEK